MPSLYGALCSITRLSIGFITLLAIVEYVCRPRDPYRITPGFPGSLEVESPAKRLVDSAYPFLVIATILLGPGSVFPFGRGRECACTCTSCPSVPPSTNRRFGLPSPLVFLALLRTARSTIGNTLNTFFTTLAFTRTAATSLLSYQLSKIPQVLRKSAVFNGRGIERLFMSILPSLPAIPSFPTLSGISKALQKPSVDNGRGIESLRNELNDAITDALRDLENLHNWACAAGVQWDENNRETLENDRVELERLHMWVLADAKRSCAVEAAQAIPIPAEIESTGHGEASEAMEEGDNAEERVEKGDNEEVESNIGKVTKRVEEAEVKVDIGGFFELVEQTAEVEIDVGKFFELAEKAPEAEADVGEFFELVEKVEAEAEGETVIEDVGKVEEHGEHIEEADERKEVGEVENIAVASEETEVVGEDVIEVTGDVKDVKHTAEMADAKDELAVEDVIDEVAEVTGEVEHATENVKESMDMVEEVVVQVLGEEADAVVEAAKSEAPVGTVEQNIDDVVEKDKVEIDGVTKVEESEEAASKRRMAMWEAEARTKGESKTVLAIAPKKYTWDEDWTTAEDDDDGGDWFTISRGKAIKTSSLSSSRPAPPMPTKTVPETATAESQKAGSSSSSVGQESAWDMERRAQKLPAFPSEPRPVAQPHQCYRIIPANEPNWLEARAERYKKEMEAWHAFKEAERAAERAKIEEAERKVRETREAKAAHIANFDTAMSRIDELLNAAKEAKEKWEKEKEENEKVLKKIDLAQGRIGELIDLEKIRNRFDPEVLGSSSLFSAAVRVRIDPGHKISKASSSSSAVAEVTTLPDSKHPGIPSSSSAIAETTVLPDVEISESSSSISAIVEVASLPGLESVELSSETSTVVEEITPSNLEISEATSSSAVPMTYASAADSITFQSNAAERSVPPQTMTNEEEEAQRRKVRQQKATQERRKRRKKAHAKWLAQQVEAEHDGESSGSGEAR